MTLHMLFFMHKAFDDCTGPLTLEYKRGMYFDILFVFIHYKDLLSVAFHQLYYHLVH